MANGSILTLNGKLILLNRGYKLTPDYLPMSKFKVGVNNTTPNIADTNLDFPIPLNNGTVCDNGDNQLTGSSGGDNTTDNTSIYKSGAGETDDTAQNLIANNTNATKIWTIADLSALGTNIDGTQYAGLWLYIKDATTLAKFVTTGTCLELKLGSDSSNYFSIVFEATDFVVGWNWITSNDVVNNWTETLAVGAPIDTFIIEITTNNATDTFVAGDVVYDLLRQWEYADIVKNYVTGYPTINETNLEVETRGFVSAVEANGYDINGYADFNNDTINKMGTNNTITPESKADTDQFTFITKTRLL